MSEFFQNTWDLICKGAMMAAGFISGIYTSSGMPIKLLAAIMIANYLSGLALAFLKKSDKSAGGGLSSAAGMKGLVKKGLIVLVILICALLDKVTGQTDTMFQSAATWFYISNESISLIENLALAGVPVPKKLKSALEKLGMKEKEEQNG